MTVDPPRPRAPDLGEITKLGDGLDEPTAGEVRQLLRDVMTAWERLPPPEELARELDALWAAEPEERVLRLRRMVATSRVAQLSARVLALALAVADRRLDRVSSLREGQRALEEVELIELHLELLGIRVEGQIEQDLADARADARYVRGRGVPSLRLARCVRQRRSA